MRRALIAKRCIQRPDFAEKRTNDFPPARSPVGGHPLFSAIKCQNCHEALLRTAGAATMSARLMSALNLAARQRRQQALAGDLVGMLVAPVGEDHDAELLARNHADIGRRVLEAAG